MVAPADDSPDLAQLIIDLVDDVATKRAGDRTQPGGWLDLNVQEEIALILGDWEKLADFKLAQPPAEVAATILRKLDAFDRAALDEPVDDPDPGMRREVVTAVVRAASAATMR